MTRKPPAIDVEANGWAVELVMPLRTGRTRVLLNSTAARELAVEILQAANVVDGLADVDGDAVVELATSPAASDDGEE
jgi:hypothetical protein